MPELALPAVRKAAAPAPFARLKALLSHPYAALEARRNRVLYAGWPVLVVATLPLAAVIASLSGLTPGQGVSGALLAWATIGLPVSALLFGAVAGAGLRTKAAEDEAALPVSARARAFGALGTAAAAFAATALLVGALTFLASPDASGAMHLLMTWGDQWPMVGGLAFFSLAIGALSAGWLLAVSFEVAYASAHAVLGGVAAAFGAALALLPLLAGCAMYTNHPSATAFPFLGAALLSSAAGVGGALVSLGGASSRVARRSRPGWKAVLAMALLPLVGSLGAWPALYAGRTRLLAERNTPNTPWDPARQNESEAARAGGLQRSLGGRLVLVGPSRDVVLLPGWRPSLADLVEGRQLPMVASAFRDDSGRVWAAVFTRGTNGLPGTYDIMTGPPSGPLKRYMTVPGNMELALYKGQAAINTNVYSFDLKNYVPLDPAKPPFLKR
ncbi:MAG: hypothetical protein KGL53_10440 [Elusimicrobia bacterium]|nr:hypothetical protein [Elusimicrobiota bacterium]